MRIVHICLACFYIDGMAYQENILPKYHSRSHEVYIITSDFSFDASGRKTKKEKKEYYNEYNIPVKVLGRSKGIGSRYGSFKKLYSTLCDIQPDVIFCHGGQFISLKDVVRYCKKNLNVKLYVDQHGDYYNTPVDTLKKRMGQYFIYGHWMRASVRYCEKFWGVTPWRCEYLNDIYRIPKNKIDFLPMGGDDEKIDFENQSNIRNEIRKQHSIAEADFLIITGGKIDKTKNIQLLVRAIKEIERVDVHLLIFGQPSKVFEKDFFAEIGDCEKIHHIGWISSEKVYDYFLASDLCVFPGTHSVLWEQACACGLPGIYKSWDGMHHVDVDGSAIFLLEDSVQEIKDKVSNIVNDAEKYSKMKTSADKAKFVFFYRKISSRAINED